MKTMRGPAKFLGQFAGGEVPFNSLDEMAKRASGLGFVAVLPAWARPDG